MSTRQGDSLMSGQSPGGQSYVGHTHFWQRAMMTRRQFIGTSAAATGAILSSGLWTPGLALASGAAPKPIPGGLLPFHIFLPGHGSEPSTITDFHGFIGLAHVQGKGTGTNTDTGQQSTLTFDVDVRFMQGVYIGTDGEKHLGTFSFI